MPRNVRNFWVEVEIDGRRSKLAGGPVGKEGGLKLRILQRENGEISCAARVECFAGSDGSLATAIIPNPAAEMPADRWSVEYSTRR